MGRIIKIIIQFMNTEPEPNKTSVKPHKGRVFRNIWLVSIAVFILTLIGMGASIVTDQSGTYDAVGIFTLILIISGVVGGLSFLIWIFKIGNKFIKAVILALVGLFLFLIFIASLVRYAIVDGNSMEPGFKHNEIYLVNKMSYKTASPQRGDVVSYTLGDGVGEYMGRVVGLPNETVVITKGGADINGGKLDEPYANWTNWLDSDKKEIGLKSDEYLILLDKRTEKINVINKQNIIGKFTFKFWQLNK